MRITETQLRKIVREVISQDQARIRFGDHLFGDTRKKPTPDAPEPDTDEEKELSDHLGRWFWGGLSGAGTVTQDDIDTLVDLKGTGLYDDVLQPPESDSYYRLLTFESPDAADEWLGEDITDSIAPKFSNNSEVASGVVKFFKVRPGAQHSLRRVAASWTCTKDSLIEMMEVLLEEQLNFDTVYASVILKTPADDSAFIINHEELESMIPSQEQAEVLQVAKSVPVEGFVICLDPEFADSSDAETVGALLGELTLEFVKAVL